MHLIGNTFACYKHCHKAITLNCLPSIKKNELEHSPKSPAMANCQTMRCFY